MEELNGIKAYIDELHKKNGPDHDDYDTIVSLLEKTGPEDIDFIREQLKPVLNPNTLFGFSYTKPFGYNGDFFIIEKMYQQYVNPNKKYSKWDQFAHRLPVVIAVVNRKKLAIQILQDYHNKAAGTEKKVLILGSGPVSEVFEFLSENPESPLKFDLLDLDDRAIKYAKDKTRKFQHKLTFYNKNVIRFTPENSYDLIWSAGLFDYFKDKHFVFLLKKYYQYLNEGGEIMFGNLNIENPSRKIMEILGDWFLYYRSEEDLIKFAIQAGVPEDEIEVTREPLGINLFLRVGK